jgi:hypothetical protein
MGWWVEQGGGEGRGGEKTPQRVIMTRWGSLLPEKTRPTCHKDTLGAGCAGAEVGGERGRGGGCCGQRRIENPPTCHNDTLGVVVAAVVAR